MGTTLSQMLNQILGASWMSSLMGWVTGLAIVIFPTLQSGRWPTSGEWASALGAVIAGRLLKDCNKVGTGSGGTFPPSPPAPQPGPDYRTIR